MVGDVAKGMHSPATEKHLNLLYIGVSIMHVRV